MLTFIINTFEVLMVDLLFILLIALFTEMFLDTKEYSIRKRTSVYILTYTFALVINFFFSIHIDGKFMVDLRHIVLLIGGLYGGLNTLIVLSLFSIAFIGFYSPDEAIANSITIIIEIIFISLLFKHYHGWNLPKKLGFMGLTVGLVGFSIMKLVDYFFHFTTGYDYYIVAIYSVSILIIILALEWVRDSIAIKKRIQQAEKLEIVSHLAASISHEIRNPLTVTKGFLQMLENEDFPLEKKKEFFSLAKSELNRAEGIIRSYLTFAKPSTNTLELLDIKEEIISIIEVINPLANMNSVQIETNLTPVLVMGEKALFHQCIFNIMKNAIEAMEGKGGLLVINTIKKGTMVDIVISDTGIGMDIKQIKRLGEPYFH